MTNEIKNTLYNKTKEELTFEDKIYINKIRRHYKSNRNSKIISSFMALLFIVLVPVVSWFSVPFGFFTMAVFSPAILFTSISIANDSKNMLKELGINKKELKELKKSGRLKELISMYEPEELKKYNKLQDITEEINGLEQEKTDQTWQEDTKENRILNGLIGLNVEQRKEHIDIELNLKKECRKRLIEKMIERNLTSQEEIDKYFECLKTDKSDVNENIDINL